MKGIFNLLIGLYAAFILGRHVFNNLGGQERLFGFEINGYLYLLFWGWIALSCIGLFIKQNKGNRSNKS